LFINQFVILEKMTITLGNPYFCLVKNIIFYIDDFLKPERKILEKIQIFKIPKYFDSLKIRFFFFFFCFFRNKIIK